MNRRKPPRIWTRKRHAEKKSRADRRRREEIMAAILATPKVGKEMGRFAEAARGASVSLRRFNAILESVGEQMKKEAAPTTFTQPTVANMPMQHDPRNTS